MSTGSDRPDVEKERDGAQERKSRRVNGGSEMNNFELRMSKANEAHDVHMPD